MNLLAFHTAAVAACPSVVSVSIPDMNNRAAWVVQYDPLQPPSSAQLAAVAQVIATFDTKLLADPPPPVPLEIKFAALVALLQASQPMITPAAIEASATSKTPPPPV